MTFSEEIEAIELALLKEIWTLEDATRAILSDLKRLEAKVDRLDSRLTPHFDWNETTES